jgi:nodulation protein E
VRRVVITGMGCVAACGNDAISVWTAMREGLSAIRRLESFDASSLRSAVGAEVRGFDPREHFDPRRCALLDRFAQLAIVAAREAVLQSGLDLRERGGGSRAGIVIGTGVGGEQTREAALERLYGRGEPRVHPLTVVRQLTNAPASHISMEFGVTGPAFMVSSACASANHAMSVALQMIRGGGVDLVITGGTEACLSYGNQLAWESMHILADDTCRPFSRERRGLVLGEGAGIFLFEEREHALERGAVPLAEVAGAGMSSDAGDLVSPDAAGAARAMRAALADACLDAAEVDYVNAHGTGTPLNDLTETKAIRMAFGDHADRLWISSTKAVHGHALGAAGAVELVAAIGALREGIVPPTANYLGRDADCDLDYVPNEARERRVRAALSNSFAFGGLNAVIALRRA